MITEAADLIHIMNDRTPDLVEPFFSLAGKRLFRSPHPSYLGDLPSTVTREAARFEFGLRPETTVVRVDFSNATLADHTTLERLHGMAREWPNARLELVALSHLDASSSFPTAFHAVAAVPPDLDSATRQ